MISFDAFGSTPEGRPSVAWLWDFVRPFRATFAKAVALAMIVSVLQMLLPVFTQIIIDKVVVDGDVGLLRIVVISMMVVLVFMSVALVVQRYLLSFAAVRIDAASLDFLMRKLLALPMMYFATRRTGDIQRRLEGLRRVREFVVQHVAAVTLMFIYSPLLGLVFLATAPVYVLLMRVSSRKLRPIFADLEEGFGRYHSYQIDAIKGIETVKAVSGEGGFRRAMLNQFHTMGRRQFNADFTMMVYDGGIQVVTLLSMTLFLWVGAYQVMAGTLTIGALVAFNSLVALANAPIVQVLSLWDGLQVAGVLLNRLDDIFEQEPEQGADRSGLLPVRTLEGRVRFANVGFRYGGPDDIFEQEPEQGADRSGLLPVPRVHQLRGGGRQDRGHRGPQRFGEDHAGQVPGGSPGADRGHDLLRWHRSPEVELPGPATASRIRPAGESPLRRHDRPQHRVRRG